MCQKVWKNCPLTTNEHKKIYIRVVEFHICLWTIYCLVCRSAFWHICWKIRQQKVLFPEKFTYWQSFVKRLFSMHSYLISKCPKSFNENSDLGKKLWNIYVKKYSNCWCMWIIWTTFHNQCYFVHLYHIWKLS